MPSGALLWLHCFLLRSVATTYLYIRLIDNTLAKIMVA